MKPEVQAKRRSAPYNNAATKTLRGFALLGMVLSNIETSRLALADCKQDFQTSYMDNALGRYEDREHRILCPVMMFASETGDDYKSRPFIQGAEFRKLAIALPGGTTLSHSQRIASLKLIVMTGKTSSSWAKVRGPQSGAVTPG